MPFPAPFVMAMALILSALAPRPHPASMPAAKPGRAPSVEADVRQTVLAYRHARQFGDSVGAIAAFTPSAWTVDQTEKPVHSRFVRLAGCRGWCRPAPPLRAYQLQILPDSATALAVETYQATARVSPAHRRRVHEYTVVSVLSRQGSRWLISSQTLYREVLP